MNFDECSAKNKAHSSVTAIIFPASLNKGRKSAYSFVTSLMTGYKDKKRSLIGQVSKGEIGVKTFLKIDRSCNWLSS